jgi:hypothetical protein
MYQKLDKPRPFVEDAGIAVASEVAAVPRNGPDVRIDRVVVVEGQVALVVELDGTVVAKVAENCIVDHSLCCGVVVLRVFAPASHSKRCW